MTYAILLDDYNPPGDDQYNVTFEGGLADCRALRTHNCRYFPLPKLDYVEGSDEATELEDLEGTPYTGRIVELVPVA